MKRFFIFASLLSVFNFSILYAEGMDPEKNQVALVLPPPETQGIYIPVTQESFPTTAQAGEKQNVFGHSTQEIEEFLKKGYRFEAYGIAVVIPPNPDGPKFNVAGEVALSKFEIDFSGWGLGKLEKTQVILKRVLDDHDVKLELLFDGLPTALDNKNAVVPFKNLRAIKNASISLNANGYWESLKIDRVELSRDLKNRTFVFKDLFLNVGAPSQVWGISELLFSVREIEAPFVNSNDTNIYKGFSLRSKSEQVGEKVHGSFVFSFGGTEARQGDVKIFELKPFEYKQQWVWKAVSYNEQLKKLPKIGLLMKKISDFFSAYDPRLWIGLIQRYIQQDFLEETSQDLKAEGFVLKNSASGLYIEVGPAAAQIKIEANHQKTLFSLTAEHLNLVFKDTSFQFKKLKTELDGSYDLANFASYEQLVDARMHRLIHAETQPNHDPQIRFDSLATFYSLLPDVFHSQLSAESLEIKYLENHIFFTKPSFDSRMDGEGFLFRAKGAWEAKNPLPERLDLLRSATFDVDWKWHLSLQAFIRFYREKVLSEKPFNLLDLEKLLKAKTSGVEAKGKFDFGAKGFTADLSFDWLTDLSDLTLTLPPEELNAKKRWEFLLQTEFLKRFWLNPQVARFEANVDRVSKAMDLFLVPATDRDRAKFYGLDNQKDQLRFLIEIKNGAVLINGAPDLLLNTAYQKSKKELQREMADPNRTELGY